MAQADPNNSGDSATIQEMMDVLASYIEKQSDAPQPPPVTATARQKHLDELERILRTIAKRDNPELQAHRP